MPSGFPRLIQLLDLTQLLWQQSSECIFWVFVSAVPKSLKKTEYYVSCAGHGLQTKPLEAQGTHLVMVESSFNRIFKDYQDFGGLEQIAYTVR